MTFCKRWTQGCGRVRQLYWTTLLSLAFYGLITAFMVGLQMQDTSFDLCMLDYLEEYCSGSLFRILGISVFSMLVVLQMKCSMQDAFLLQFGRRLDWWADMLGHVFCLSFLASVVTVMIALLFGSLQTGGLWECFSSRYSVYYLKTYGGEPVSGFHVLLRCFASIWLGLLYAGIVTAGLTMWTRKGYFGVLLILLMCFAELSCVFELVNASYRFYVEPDHTLLLAVCQILVLILLLTLSFVQRRWRR